ncbi:hypothetical protein KsCSTR_01470 [Candidatus Kuenenia stuttgartiensis]|uniref:Uncharacterized protein n=1 Tax=Kuenenia stuttgartiensis TaxID=174633 RepID=Q1PUZ8_KUEST|nr:hypothetical protein KsCSTR_01470 [Candidatus Kuenenia stuttgartiensis]CAJ71055.1 unknown protein [Candidatus Kuenenia stuttgartiensis]
MLYPFGFGSEENERCIFYSIIFMNGMQYPVALRHRHHNIANVRSGECSSAFPIPVFIP